MNLLSNTRDFWNSVAKEYSNSDMTTHQNDFELDFIKKNISKIKSLEGIVSLGCANGIRDPLFIINNCDQKKLNEVTCLDISEKMIEECFENLKSFNFKKNFIRNKVSDFNEFNSSILKKSLFICGVYNANYIIESLKIYKNNISKTGEIFTIKPIILNDNCLLEMNDHSLTFNINNYQFEIEKILKMRNLENFYAYNIKTEINFISHFFDSSKLLVLLNLIFKESINMINDEKYPRYLIFTVGNNDISNCNYMITMLNNVLGNIITNEQILSLNNINKLFF